ncbi:ABC transporter permease [Alphaproteobacteria bacterium]|nr:ABC transporter permease [Alphaproteobacteria bacterium]GHS96063.1 ABC transporter permease [Alphaproteobacteria bacterium]
MVNQRRTVAIFNKEIRHILRDPFTLIFSLVMPVVMVLLFGTAIEFNVREVPTVYVDQDHSQTSRTFLNTLGSSQYFKITPVASAHEGIRWIERERARAMIIIPPQFEHFLLGAQEGKLQVLVDGTDNSSGNALVGYLGAIQAKTLQNLSKSDHPASEGALKTRFLYNPELSSRWFTVPALTAVVMAILSILLTALTISREWENGSMELLLSTPVRPMEVVLGKMLPYALLGLISVFVVYIIARTLYGIPFIGQLWIFWVATLMFLLTYLGQGLLISTLIRNQQAAIQFALMIGMMPSMLFSGFIFPIEHMPTFFQGITACFPARWYVTIVRDQFLKGSSALELFLPLFMLFVFTCMAIRLCTKTFKGNLES